MDQKGLQQIATAAVIIILMICAVVTKMITRVIGSDQLSRATTSFFRILATLVILRFIAVGIDYYFGFRLSIFSTIVGVGSYIYLLYLLTMFYINLKRGEAELHKTDGSIISPILDKQRIGGLIDGLFYELSVNKKKTKDLQKDIEATLKKYG